MKAKVSFLTKIIYMYVNVRFVLISLASLLIVHDYKWSNKLWQYSSDAST